MRLQPNIGSDRSWVWKVAADYSEEPATAETLAIRFANAESECVIMPGSLASVYMIPDAQQFKDEFEKAQKHNVELGGAPPEAKPEEAPATEEKEEEPAVEEKKEEEAPAAAEEKKEE